MQTTHAIPPEAILEPYPPGHRAIADALRAVVREAVPDVIERVRPGWGLIGYDVPYGRGTRYFAFVWPEPEHVHLGFEQGVLMDDPEGRLQGAGQVRQVRWLTFTDPADVRPDDLVPIVREAVRVATLSAAERALRREEVAARS